MCKQIGIYKPSLAGKANVHPNAPINSCLKKTHPAHKKKRVGCVLIILSQKNYGNSIGRGINRRRKCYCKMIMCVNPFRSMQNDLKICLWNKFRGFITDEKIFRVFCSPSLGKTNIYSWTNSKTVMIIYGYLQLEFTHGFNIRLGPTDVFSFEL